MRSAWILPVALHSILAFAAPAAEANEELVYGDIKLTYATPSPSTISLNFGLAERDVAAETGSCLTKPSNVHSKSRTRARHHIRTCGESGGTCLPSSTGAPVYKAVSSAKPVQSSVSSSAIDYTTTVITTIYETYCPGTSTVTSKGSTYPVTYPSSSKVTETYTTVVPVKETPSSVAPVTSKVPIVYTTESTYYETKTITRTTIVPCEGTYTYTSETVTKTSVYPSSSTTTITETSTVPYTSTLTVTTHAVPSSTKAVPASSSTSCTNDFGVVPPYDFLSSTKAVPASHVPVTYTTESTYYETYTIVETVTVPCPGTKTVTSEHSTYTTEYSSHSVETVTVTTTFPATTTITVTTSSPVGSSTKAVPSSSEVAYTTTVYTVVYTTTCPGTSTITSYGTTLTQTYPSSTVVTETITKSYPVTSEESKAPETSSKTRHHSHSHHGHVTSETIKSYGTAGSSSKASSKHVKSSGSKVSSYKASSTGVSSKASVSSNASVSSKASASSKASSVVPSLSASKSSSKSACSTPTEEPKCIPCEGQPGSDPKKWCGLTINDDSYKVVPKTCRTVVYDFEITNTTIAPDGVPRIGMLVNGEMPGPAIEANWGDTIVVHVHNKLENNGTSIHFHGSRQYGTNEMDGATSITQCPIAPGHSYTYKFVASNYGHSWYHSHFALQAYNGVFGPMIIHGPHSAEYDVDAGVLSLQDWTHDTVDATFGVAQTVGPFPEHGPRTMDLGLINGQNVWNGTGERHVLETEFESGKSYLLRLVNVARQSSFKFYIDSHSLQVISADYVPIKPYTTNIINLHPGQRYEVIVKADQAPGSYWMRSDSQDTCSAMLNSKDVKGVINYKGFDDEPTSTAYTYTQECVDEPLASLVPVVSKDAGAQDESISKTVLIGPGPQTPNLFKWTLDGSTFVSRWGEPSLLDLSVNGTIPNFAGSLQVRYPKLGEWVYLVVQSPIPLPHPIHLHGHDFLVVSSGLGFYTGQPLNLKSPPRRDTALMPASASSGGYLVLAWEVDNPGSWLAHCHIADHAAMGFSMEIIEGELADIEKTLTNSCQIQDTCKAWNAYSSAAGILDTGI